MQVYPAQVLKLSGSVVTIGAFDGVHRGHQALIGGAAKRAQTLGAASVVYTFDPPPRAYFQGALVLTSLESKLRMLEKLGAEYTVVAHFDEAYAARSAESFLDELLDLNPQEVWVGPDFRFGRDGLGDVGTLAARFETRTFQRVRCEAGEVISSSRVRSLLVRGAVKEAQALLG